MVIISQKECNFIFLLLTVTTPSKVLESKTVRLRASVQWGETEVGLQQQATDPALLEAKSASKTIQMRSKVNKLNSEI